MSEDRESGRPALSRDPAPAVGTSDPVPTPSAPGAATGIGPSATPDARVHPVRSLRGREGRGRPSDRLLRFGVRPFLVLADVVAWLLAVLPFGGPVGRDLVLLALVVWLYGAAGAYRSRLTLSALDDVPMLVGRALAAAALASSVALLVDPALVGRDLLASAALLAVLVVLFRTLAYAVVRRSRRNGWVSHATLVLGAGKIGGQLVSLLQEHRACGLEPVGFLDDDPLLTEDERTAPLLGGPADLARVLVEFGVRDVIVSFGSMREEQTVEVIRTCDRLDVEIFFVPRLFELHQSGRDMDQVWGVPLVRLRRAAFRSWTWRVKRVVDVVVSAVALVVLSPLLALIALAVRLEGGPGVLFRQERVGLDGRPFMLLKFRSLRPVDEDESQTKWSIRHDDRLGPVGRVLRASSMDELAQLLNVLRGDMSLVGPRPERPHFVATFTRTFPRYVARHRVPAGLTGWAQVHGLRGDTSIADRARFDNHYIEGWSLWGDFKIMLRTVSAVLRGSGG